MHGNRYFVSRAVKSITAQAKERRRRCQHSPTRSKPFRPSITLQNFSEVTVSSAQFLASHAQYGWASRSPGCRLLQVRVHLLAQPRSQRNQEVCNEDFRDTVNKARQAATRTHARTHEMPSTRGPPPEGCLLQVRIHTTCARHLRPNKAGSMLPFEHYCCSFHMDGLMT